MKITIDTNPTNAIHRVPAIMFQPENYDDRVRLLHLVEGYEDCLCGYGVGKGGRILHVSLPLVEWQGKQEENEGTQ